jgi:hypothetical protein
MNLKAKICGLLTRGIQSNEATELLLYDFFEQTEGNLEGKTVGSGGATWSEAEKTGSSGFEVNATSHVAERTHTSDSNLNAGCYALAGSSSYTTVQVQANVAAELAPIPTQRFGVLARYSSPEHWLMAILLEDGAARIGLEVLKRVSGTVTSLGLATVGWGGFGVTNKVSLSVAADGSWQAWAYEPGGPPGAPLLSGQDPVLATGGTLASGKVGLYDAWAESAPNIRQYANFEVFASAEAGRVCFADKKVEARWDGTERQDSTGTYYGPPSSERGGKFFVPCAGAAGAVARVAVKMRRNDVTTEPDSNVTDKQTVEVKIRERFLAPR